MDNISKNKLHREFIEILIEAFEKKTSAEWDQILTENDIPHSVAQSWEEVLEDKQAWANDVFYNMEYPTGNTRALVRQPVFVGDDLPDYKMAPLLGEHSEEIIRSLGYTEEQLNALHEAGVYNTWDDLKGFHNG